jgi:hypothetical protein
MVMIFRCHLRWHVLNSSLLLLFGWAFGCNAMNQSPVNTEQVKKESEEIVRALTDQKFTDFFDQQHQENASVKKDQALVTSKQQRIKRYHFYNDYLARYYPKAFVITYQIFQHLDPDGIEQALHDIVNIFADKAWFYFFNKPQGFKIIHFWEFIVDQLCIIHDFLEHACVNIDDQTVFMPSEDDFFVLSMLMLGSKSRQSRNRKLLMDYLTAPRKTVIYEFYAQCFDFEIKLFNEGILLQNLGQSMIYLSELEYLVEKLSGSVCFAADYQGASIKTAQELLDLLKHRFGINNEGFGDAHKSWAA